MKISTEFLRWTWIIGTPVFILAFEYLKQNKPYLKTSYVFAQLCLVSFFGILVAYGSIHEIRIGQPLALAMICFGLAAFIDMSYVTLVLKKGRQRS